MSGYRPPLDRRVLTEGLIPCSVCEEPLFPVGGETAHQSHSLGERRRDEGIARAVAANPADADRVLDCIRQVAAERPELSANDVRHLHPGIKQTKVIGAAWQRAIRSGLITPTGRVVRSRGDSANAHHIHVYRSRVFRGAA